MKGKLIIISVIVASLMAMLACTKENAANNGDVDVETVAISETAENQQKG